MLGVMLTGKDERVLEIRRGLTASIAKVAVGSPLIALVIAIGILNPPPTGPLVIAVVVGGLGLLMVLGGLQVIVRRPLWLRASAAGLWFGGGPVIPWQEVTAIYHGSAANKHMGAQTQATNLAFAFRHKRTVLRLPLSCWLTTPIFGDVLVSTSLRSEPAPALLALLEAMRTAACGTEDGAVVGATQPPAARVLRR